MLQMKLSCSFNRYATNLVKSAYETIITYEKKKRANFDEFDK